MTYQSENSCAKNSMCLSDRFSSHASTICGMQQLISHNKLAIMRSIIFMIRLIMNSKEMKTLLLTSSMLRSKKKMASIIFLTISKTCDNGGILMVIRTNYHLRYCTCTRDIVINFDAVFCDLFIKLQKCAILSDYTSHSIHISADCPE